MSDEVTRQNIPPEAVVTQAALADAPSAGTLKIRFLPKAIVFACAVLTLSWFFEGWRQVNTNPSITGFAILIGGTLGTAFLLTLSAYWIYIEEKSRGALKKKIKLFEKIYAMYGAKKEREIG